MLFNSIDFAVFLPIVFILYWFGTNNNHKHQNFLIVVASYIFYGWWDWRFLSLILFSTLIDYSVGRKLNVEKNHTKRKILLWISIGANIGFLGFFKYFNFFLDNFIAAFTFFGTELKGNSLNIILPVGISFYTFQTMSYTIDVYKRKLEPTKDLIAFAAYVSFFPQLVAGPIERAKNLLPQFYTRRTFDHSKAVDGMRQILWGLFKKIAIADNVAYYVNDIFSNYAEYNSSTLLLGGVLFAFQIYCDFSGYSDIAIGTARLFGFNLMRNFAYPYFSRDIAEFWRRWHISLSTWFRDYVYIPMGGSRVKTSRKVVNIFTIFIVSGLWHGASWTFIIWGILNAIFFLPLLLLKRNRINTNIVAEGKILPSLKELIGIIFTFLLTTLAWIFFRAESLSHAISYISNIFTKTVFSKPDVDVFIYPLIGLIILFISIEWVQREKQHSLELTWTKISKPVRWILYLGILVFIVFFGRQQQEFIYFQF